MKLHINPPHSARYKTRIYPSVSSVQKKKRHSWAHLEEAEEAEAWWQKIASCAFLMRRLGMIFLPADHIPNFITCLYNLSLRPAKRGFSNQHIQYCCWQPKGSWSQSIQVLAGQQKYGTIVWISPSAISDLSQVYAICLSPLARELKGTNDSCLTDGSALCVCEGMRFLDAGGWGGGVGGLRFNPSLSHGLDQDGGLQAACHGRLIQSGKEGVYMPHYLHTEAYVRMILGAENHFWLLLSHANSFCHRLMGYKVGIEMSKGIIQRIINEIMTSSTVYVGLAIYFW